MRFLPVRDRSQIVEARQEACEHARELGFDDETSDRVAIVATEGATNFIRHASGGSILFGCEPHAPDRFNVIFIDSGPGIPKVERALEDGFSTAGGLGQGLGAMRRLSDGFDLYSRDEGGVTITTRFQREAGDRYARAPGEPRAARGQLLPGSFQVDGFVVPMPGQTDCGDGWMFHERPDVLRLMMCDGLGHGAGASAATEAAKKGFRAARDVPLIDAIEIVDQSLKGTRGAAALLIDVPVDAAAPITAVGVGNISAEIVTRGKTRRIVSYDGIVGKGHRKAKVLAYDDADWTMIVSCSDGLRHRWDHANYPGLAARDPLTIAATLWRDFNRGTDDSGIAVIKARAA